MIVDSVLVGKNVIYDIQDDDVCEDISVLNACANISIMKKDDVDFVINKTFLDLSMKNVCSKGLMEISLSYILIIGHMDVEYFVRKRLAAKKEVDDLSQKIVLNIVLSRCYMGGF